MMKESAFIRRQAAGISSPAIPIPRILQKKPIYALKEEAILDYAIFGRRN